MTQALETAAAAGARHGVLEEYVIAGGGALGKTATQRARDASSVEVQRMSDVLCRRSSSRLAFLVCRTASTASVYCFSCVHVESRCRRVGRRGTPDG